MREVTIASILYGFDQKKKTYFERWYWFKFNNIGLAQGMDFKFYTSVVERS